MVAEATRTPERAGLRPSLELEPFLVMPEELETVLGVPPLRGLDRPQPFYERGALPPQCRDVRGVEMGRGHVSYYDVDHTVRWYGGSPATPDLACRTSYALRSWAFRASDGPL